MQTTAPTLTLVQLFKELSDPRVVRRCDHELSEVLVIALCCLLCGGETFYDMEQFGEDKYAWLKTFLALPNGIPRHDTFNRVFAALKPEAFLDCFLRWTQSVRQTVAGEIVAALHRQRLGQRQPLGAGPAQGRRQEQ